MASRISRRHKKKKPLQRHQVIIITGDDDTYCENGRFQAQELASNNRKLAQQLLCVK